MKRFKTLLLTMMMISILSLNVFASDLDAVISQASTVTAEEVTEESLIETNETVQETVNYKEGADLMEEISGITNSITNRDFLDEANSATDLKYNEKAAILNDAIGNVAGFVIQVMAYCIVSLLIVSTLLDLMYITIPFIRTILEKVEKRENNNNYNAMNNMGTSNYSGGFNAAGGNTYNQNSLMGNNQMNMSSNNVVKSKFISDEALNAVLNNENGKAAGALRLYSKDLIIKSVLVTLLITLIISGVLLDLGFVIGDVIVNLLSGLDKML